MTLLNLRKSQAFVASLFIFQLSVAGAHPVRLSGTGETSNVDNRLTFQRVTRNDQYQAYQPFEDKAEVVPSTDASFSEAAALDQESSGTESPLIQEEINPFILVADDGAISSAPVREPLEIVTPSFLEIPDAPVTVSEVEPAEKLEDPSVDTRIVAESFYDRPAHSPSESQWPPVASSDPMNDVPPASTDLPVAFHSPSTFVPIPEEVESFQKLEEPSFDPLVALSPVSSEVQPIQKIEDVAFDDTAVSVSNEPQLSHNAEISSESLDIIAPVVVEDTPNQSVVDPSIDSIIFTAPVSDETVAIQDNHSVDLSSVDVSISDGAQHVHNLENPSGNAMEFVPVLVQDVSEFSVDTGIVAEPVTNIVTDPISQVATHEPQSPSAEHPNVDFLPQAVFISTVLPASTITIAPFKLHEPASPSLYSVTSPKKITGGNSVTYLPVTTGKPEVPAVAILADLPSPAKTNLKSYPAGQQLKQQSHKQPPINSKVKAQSKPIVTSSLKSQIQINESKYQATSPTPSPIPAYGPPRATLATSNGKNNFSARPFGSSPKPRQLGFPPVSNTRDNVLLQVNWAANVGRPYRST